MKESDVNAHWQYVESVIRAEWDAFATVMDMDARNVEAHCKVIEHHYKTAMVHGYKHGVEATKHARGCVVGGKGIPVDGWQAFEEAGP